VEEANARLAVTENASRDILETYENNKTLVRSPPSGWPVLVWYELGLTPCSATHGTYG